MIKKVFISVSSKEGNRGSVEFQIFSFTNKIRRFTSQLELHKNRLFISERVAENSRKTPTTIGLFV